MKRNVGQLGFRDFVGIGILVVIGLVVYGRFQFEQKVPPQDVTATRLNDLEKKSLETQTKLDQIQDALNQIRLKTTEGGAPKPKPKKPH
jgi:hypothetical protein